jgi:2-polyprenyl-6-methoxyphenol hydroxylase-like FAD-dependent oxidoreductase
VEVGGAKLEALAVIAADGRSSQAVQALNMGQVAQRSSQALGVVAHYQNGQTAAERNLRQCTWAKQFNSAMFEEMYQKTGADLENIVYYRAEQIHYFVMTPTRKCLVDAGVLKQDLPAPALTARDNIDAAKLATFSRRVATHQGIPAGSALIASASDVFDFSETQRAEAAAVGRVFLVGDALLEPFWPEGLGIVRGFLTVLDAVTAISLLSEDGDRQALALVEKTYALLKGLCLKSGPAVLLPAKGHGTHPKTRYKAF